MNTAAVIVAAGMSSRMGDFKPMLNIGSISIAQRIIATLQQAGVSEIVMITGYNATLLEKHLSNSGLIFLRNENYAHTQMFDSAKIGLDYLKDKCDRILFTPVDIPLFTSTTVCALLDSDALLACPVYDGERGHPILISTSLIDNLLNDEGKGGLKGALDRCGVDFTEIEVDDSGILHDADTPQDYQELVQLHNQQLIRPVVNVSLAKELPFFNRKIAILLEQIEETYSVRTACQRMQLSYSSGWNIIRTLESQLNKTLIERNQGGAGGGQSRLTDDAKKLLKAFNIFENRLKDAAVELFDEFLGEIF